MPAALVALFAVMAVGIIALVAWRVASVGHGQAAGELEAEDWSDYGDEPS